MKTLAISLSFSLSVLFASFVVAEEPAEQFLEALREAGYFDIAVDYLDSLEKGDLVSSKFRSQMPFEKAATLVAVADTLKDFRAAEVKLDEAQQILTEFGGRDPSLESQARTAQFQGKLYYSRSKAKEFQGNNDRLTAAEKEVFSSAAREMLKNALASYQTARAKVRALIDPNSSEGLKIDVEDPSTTAKLRKYQTVYAQIRVQLPLVIEKLADTYPDNDPERIKNLTEAVKEYNNVYDDYFKYPAGLDARLFAARCQQKLGQHKEALITLEDIFNFSENSNFRKLKRNAFIIACDSWNKIEPYPVLEVVSRLEPVVAVLNREEIREPDWLRIQMELAIAKHQQALEVKAAGGPTATSDSAALDRAAAKILRNVARSPSDHRDRARQLVSEWNVSMIDTAEPAAKAPESFVDARQRAKDKVLEIEALFIESNQLKQKLAAAPATEKPTLAAELEETEQRITNTSTAALDLLNLALKLTDDNTQRADVNNVRYLQSFCYFSQQLYFESALIGAFLLDKYPNVDGTRPATNLMIQSYIRLLDEAKGPDKSYEMNQLTSACSTVIERWPGSSESGLAASTLIKLAINDKDFAAAEKYFAEIPDNFSARGALASRLGQRLWFDYKAKSPGTNDQQEALKEQLTKTITYLGLGAKQASLKDLDYETALGCLLLVDAYLEAGQVEPAIQRLENSEIAPLDLVKQKHPAIMESSLADLFVRETYKVAIKTYLAAMQGSGEPQKWIDKANGVIAAMRVDMESNNDPKARQQVTQIYALIATELLKQFEQLNTPAEKTEFSKSLLSFLSSIEKDSKDSRIILWAGSTLLNVANSLNDTDQAEEAKPLFTQAVSALSRAETLGFAGDPQVDAMTTELQRQRALAQRGAGNFEAAVEQFVQILEKNTKNLNVQLDAAETLQAWGKATGRAPLYVEAMMGSKPQVDPKTKRQSNLIWGWRRMSQATRGNEKFADAFYQSLYRLAECRLEWGLLEKKSNAVQSALTEIENAEKRDATMGGPAWKPKFEQLKVRIKQNL